MQAGWQIVNVEPLPECLRQHGEIHLFMRANNKSVGGPVLARYDFRLGDIWAVKFTLDDAVIETAVLLERPDATSEDLLIC